MTKITCRPISLAKYSPLIKFRALVVPVIPGIKAIRTLGTTYVVAPSRLAPNVVTSTLHIFFVSLSAAATLASAVARLRQGPVSDFKVPCNDEALI